MITRCYARENAEGEGPGQEKTLLYTTQVRYNRLYTTWPVYAGYYHLLAPHTGYSITIGVLELCPIPRIVKS
jgi:hypothetical protein